MLEEEFCKLLERVRRLRCETQTLEVKAARTGCPERLYDTFSAFANQTEGGVILFGVDETQGFRKVGVYDAQALQKRLMEVGEEMTPAIRPQLTVFEEGEMRFVTAEIPPVGPEDRPCFKTAKGRLKGAYVRVGDADKPMTEYEVYRYEAYRRQLREDVRPVPGVPDVTVNHEAEEAYARLRQKDRPNLAALAPEALYELLGLRHEGVPTLADVMLFNIYPQGFFPQLTILATCLPGVEDGEVGAGGERFIDSRRLEGTLTEQLEAAMTFVERNTRTAIRIDPKTGRRDDFPEYPTAAVREALVNALLHRDYGRYAVGMPILLKLFRDRLEIHSPGGLYGRLTVDALGISRPVTRNETLVTALETLGITENRYSGIPTIRRAMREAGLPEPEFQERRGDFVVTFRNRFADPPAEIPETMPWMLSEAPAVGTAVPRVEDERGLLAFCETPRSRSEIMAFLGIPSARYALRRYLYPLVEAGAIRLTLPDKPGSPNQRYVRAR